MSLHEALLLVAHGSERYPDAWAALARIAEALRAARHFAQVEVAVLNGSPSVTEALAMIGKPVIRVVPFFMEDGYFTRVVVPRAIGTAVSSLHSADRSSDQQSDNAPVEDSPTVEAPRIILCPPVGVHDGMAGVIERQALAACAGLGLAPQSAAVVIIGHGSASEPGRNQALHRHASRVAATTLFMRVAAACLEEPPFAAETLGGLRAHAVVVIGFFANQGQHVREDVTALVAAERSARGDRGPEVHFHGSVVDDPAIALIVLEQAMSVPASEPTA